MRPLTLAVVLFAMGATSEMVIAVTPDAVYPAQVSVRRGDRVRWQGPINTILEVDLEDHQGQHIVIARTGSVAVTFLDAGPHPYLVRLGAERALPGEVLVQPGPAVDGRVCARGSNRSLCIEP